MDDTAKVDDISNQRAGAMPKTNSEDARKAPSSGVSPSPTPDGLDETKLFVGGLPAEARETDLRDHFSKYGSVKWAQVKMDPLTNRSRGFGFIEFHDPRCCAEALSVREQYIQGKRCEVKRAKYRENKKVFVGGIASDFSEDELRRHFEKFGPVEEIEWPRDLSRGVRRNFAFIIFETEDAADAAVIEPRQKFASRLCDVKKAFMTIRRPAYVQALCDELSGCAVSLSPHSMVAAPALGPLPQHVHNCDHYFNHPFVLPKTAACSGDRLFGPQPSSAHLADVSNVFTTFKELLERRLDQERVAAMQAHQNRMTRSRRRPASYSAAFSAVKPAETAENVQSSMQKADPAVITCAMRDDSSVTAAKNVDAANTIMGMVSGPRNDRAVEARRAAKPRPDNNFEAEPARHAGWYVPGFESSLNRPNRSNNNRYRGDNFYNSWRQYPSWY